MEKQKEQSAPTNERKLLSDGRLYTILKILFPWGYSQMKEGDVTTYVGQSPCQHDYNVIKLRVPGWDKDSPLSLVMCKAGGNVIINSLCGYYLGIMEIIAPELYCNCDKLDDVAIDVMDFYLYDEETAEKHPWNKLSIF